MSAETMRFPIGGLKCTLILLGVFEVFGCTAKPANLSAAERWRTSSDYYALLELVDTHINPEWNGKVLRAEVVKYLGRGLDQPDEYPGAGADFWVYPSKRPVPFGSYLFVSFSEDGYVKDVWWGSEEDMHPPRSAAGNAVPFRKS